MRRRSPYTTAAEMRAIIREIETGHLSKSEARRKYNIRGGGTINYWVAKFRLSANQDPVDYKKLSKEELIKKLKQMERALEDEQLRAEGYSKMIDIAEEQLKIEIRKKSDAKQSKK